MANCFLAGRAFADVYEDMLDVLEKILESTVEAAKYGFGTLKGIDDWVDENIPGYSGYKQYNAVFLLLKTTYDIVMDDEADLKARAIKTVEAAEKSPNKSRWEYATWQMKVNLIYDMRYGGSGEGISGGLEKLTGGLWDAEKSKENAVVAVLRSSRSDGEFAKIVKNLMEPGETAGREPVYINDLLDGEQKQKFEKLKLEHNYNGM